MASHHLVGHYPHLFKEVTWPWGPTRAKFVLLDEAPLDHLIANVNIVPYSGDEWIMIRLHDGSWEIPGGTLEEENDGPLACQPIITPERHNTRPC